MTAQFNTKGSGLITVPVLLSGPRGDSRFRFALDTGAAMTTINWAVLLSLGYDPAISARRTSLTTASGVEYAPIIEVARLGALGQTRENMSIICHTLPTRTGLKGLLGLDFFKGTKLGIDFRAGTISVE